jgi:hypothetical protein
MSRRAAILVAMAITAGYAGVVVWLTWPLARLAATHFPKTMMTSLLDVPLLMWALAHESRAVLSPASFDNAGIFHPAPHTLFFGENGLGALPLFAPVFLPTGNPVLAIDFVFLAGVTMTATMLHAAAQIWSRSHLAGLVAGTTFLATPWVLWGWVPTAPNYAVLFYLPAIMVLAARATPGRWPAMRLGTLVALQGLASAYVAAATFMPLGVLALARVARRSTRRAGVMLLVALSIAAVVLAVGFSGYVLVRMENPGVAEQSPYSSLKTVGFDVIPSSLRAPMRATSIPAASLAVIVLGAIARLSRNRAAGTTVAWRHCMLWIAVGLYVSLSPHVFVFGRDFSPPRILPSAVYDVLRASYRLAITALVGACVLAGVAFHELAARLPGRATRLALAAALVGGIWVGYAQPVQLLGVTRSPLEPYPTIAMRPPTGPIGTALLGSTGPLLELPIGPNALGHAAAMVQSIYHRHPLLNGYSGYYPESHLRTLELACRLPDRDALDELVRTTGVEWILVSLMGLDASRHGGVAPLRCPPDPRRDQAPTGSEAREWLALVAATGGEGGLRLVAREDGALLFRVYDRGIAGE